MRLEQSHPSGENLTARLAIPDITDRLHCAIDSDGTRHLLIALMADEDELQDMQSRGVSVVTRELVLRTQPAARYLDIECRDAAGYAAFDVIGGELAESLSHGDSPPSRAVERVLAKWRRFWGQVPKTLLSREELFGLFAELWFLSAWLLPRVGVAKAVQRWRGPFDARHDFEWQGKSVEVKATTSTRGRIHRIHGVDQLAPPDSGELFLFSLRLREEAGGANSLPGLIAHCRSRLELDAEALSQFETGLARAGYSPVHDDEYLKVSLRVIEETLFAVRDNFPRITPNRFVEGVPAGVEAVVYEVNLNAFDHLCVAKSAVEGAVLL
jgi:Putative  PD-(D/E)XK family member, (DUF4420)